MRTHPFLLTGITLTLASILLGNSAQADKMRATGHVRATTQGATGTPNERARILSGAHALNQLEMRMGALAERKGSTAEVRDYGKSLHEEHRKADRKLLSLAHDRKVNVKAPVEMGSQVRQEYLQRRQTLQKLQKLTGKDFDQAFLKAMNESHTKALAAAQMAQNRLSEDSELKDLVTEMLPKLQKHHETAQSLLSQASKPSVQTSE